MKPNCIIVEDEPYAATMLANYISDCGLLSLSASFKNANDAFAYLLNKKIDVVFCDIRMPGLSGLQLVKALQGKTKVIFTTAYRDYAVEAFELNAIDYLTKPVSYERFLIAINKTINELLLIENKNLTGPEFLISIKTNREIHRIDKNEILYIEGLGNYVKVYLQDNCLISNITQKLFIEKLDRDTFIRVNKSYIVNTSKITKLSSYGLAIGKVEIPVARVYRKKLIEIFNKHPH